MFFKSNQYIAGRSRTSSGFSLIEVMVAIVVLATGLLAMAALQAALIRNSADAKARSQMAAYGDRIMDQQRSTDYTAIPVGTNLTTIIPTSEVAALKAATGASTLTVGANITRYIGGIPTAGVFTDYSTLNSSDQALVVSKAPPEYKEVRIGFNWTDAAGSAKVLVMHSIVSPLAISTDNTLVTRPTDGGTTGSPVIRTATPTAPGVIPISIGSNTDTAATNPRPEIIGRNNRTSVVGTRYDVLTYQNEDSVTAKIQKRVETEVIACSCNAASKTSLTGIFATRFRPTYWNGTRYVPPKELDTNPPAGPEASIDQSPLCSDCCRDHHDGSTETVFFDAPNTDRQNRYKLQGGALVVANQSSDTYLDACRMIRVDGLQRVATDMQSPHLGLLRTTATGGVAAKSPIPDSTLVQNYEDFVIDFLNVKYVQNGTPNANTLYNTHGLDDPASIDISVASPTDYRYLHARGLYIDYLEQPARDAITKALTDCTDTNRVNCVLPILPFTTVNVTELASWIEAVHTPTPSVVVDVSNHSQTIFGDPLRPVGGQVNAVAAATAGDLNDVRLEMTRSNAGVAVTGAVDPDDNTLQTDTQLFRVSTGGSSGSAAAFQTLLAGLPQTSDSNVNNDPSVAWRVSNSGNCASTTTTTGPASSRDYDPNNYRCSTDSPLNVAATVIVANYNSTSFVIEDDQCDTRNNPATTSHPSCNDYAVSAVTLDGTPVVGYTTSVIGTNGTSAEGTSVGLPNVTPNGVVGVTFRLVSSTPIAFSSTMCNGRSTVWPACP